MAIKLAGVGQVKSNRYLLRLSVGEYEITLFPDGRAIIGGTDDAAQARSVLRTTSASDLMLSGSHEAAPDREVAPPPITNGADGLALLRGFCGR